MTHVKENPIWPDFVVNVDGDTKITEEEFRKLYLGEWITEEEDNTQLSKLRKAIEEVHQERDKRGPFCFSFGPYDLDEESSDEGKYDIIK